MSNIYTQTNETENKIIVFKQNPDGTLEETARVATGGKGTNAFSPSTGERNVPDSLLSSGAVLASRDGKMLFCVNAGDNTVSSFAVAEDGSVSLVDTQSTGNEVQGEAGTANSLAYNDKDNVLYVGHALGPNHIKSFIVDEGKLSLTDESKSVNTGEMNDRVITQVFLSPDNKFLLSCTLFDARPTESGLAPAKAKNQVTFPVMDEGKLGEPIFNESGGVAPFASAFLHNMNDKFITVLAGQSSAVLSTIDGEGKVSSSAQTKVDTMMDGKPVEPSEICWISIGPDNKFAYGTNFGYGTVTVFTIGQDGLSVVVNEAAKEAGDGNYKGLAEIVTSGAGDSVVCGDYFYQLYANAAKLVGYKMEDDGKLTKVGEVEVPRNSAQGLAKI